MRMTRHRTLRAIALVALTGAGITLQCPGTALALKTRPQLPFSPFGSFTGATGIAVDQANGNVLVADSAADEVRVFGATGGSPAGGAAGSLTGAQTPAGAFRWGADDSEGHEIYVHPAGVAVDNACAQHGLSGAACTAFDPSNGAIYVTDVFHDVVDKFVVNAAHEYEYVCQFTGFGFAGTACLKNEPTVQATPSEGAFEEPDGVAVDREGNVYVADGGFDEGIVDEFNAAGEDVRRMKSKEIRRLQDIAVDGKGDIYIHAYGNYRKRGEEGYPSFSEIELVRSGFTGGIEGETNPHFHTYMGPVGVGPTGLAFDLASARLFIGYAALQENTLEARQVEEYNEAGEYQTSFGLSGRGIAVNEASDDVYVANQGSISVFGPVVDTPFPVTGSASNVSTAGATVEGSVNPESSTLAAECEVQYGPTEAFGSSVPCEPANVGTGETAVPVTAHLTGLQPGLTYDYRVVARNEEGPAPGGVGSFTTKPAAPIVVGEAASSVTPGSAVLGATINTLNIGISYHFVYGLTSKYGTSIPLSDVSLAASREATPSVSLEGLLPDTTYHFAVIATSAGGTTVGPDATFSTAAPTPPVVGAVAVGGVTPESVVLSGSVDPQGVATVYELDIGRDTNYGTRIFGEAGGGVGPQSVSVSLAGLAAGSTYHCRLVASNAYGTVYGPDQTFTTPGVPGSLLVSPVSPPLVGLPPLVFPTVGESLTHPQAVSGRTAHKAKQAARKARRRRKRGGRAGRAAAKARGATGRDRGRTGRRG